MIRSMTAALARKRAALGTKDKGFTLIELLVVVLILGVLAAVAIPIFLGQQDGAKDSAVSTQVTQAKTALAVEIANGGTVKAAVTKFPALDGYTESAEITVKAVLDAGADTTSTTDDGFTITGFWKDGATSATADATNHGHVITATTVADKY